MFSLNVPLPPAIDRLANELYPQLSEFDRIRERHTLVCKRFAVGDIAAGRTQTPDPDRAVARLRERLRPVLAETDPLNLRCSGLDRFLEPTRGPGPVVYVSVESEDLIRLHRRLCGVFDPVEEIEGEAYVPHITLARGGSETQLERVLDLEIDPIEWRARSLELYDPEFREPVGTIDL